MTSARRWADPVAQTAFVRMLRSQIGFEARSELRNFPEDAGGVDAVGLTPAGGTEPKVEEEKTNDQQGRALDRDSPIGSSRSHDRH